MTDLEHPQQRWDDWVREACAAVGVDAELVDIVEIHHLSKEVAHRLERPLAPVSTFILGLALGAAQNNAAEDGEAQDGSAQGGPAQDGPSQKGPARKGPAPEPMLQRILDTLPPTAKEGRELS